MDIGGDSFEVWKKQPERIDGDFVDKWVGEYKPLYVGGGFMKRIKANKVVQEWNRYEFKKFYPNLDCPKFGEYFEVTFK